MASETPKMLEDDTNSDNEITQSDLEDDFTPVLSKRMKKNQKKISSGKKIYQGVPLSGTKTLNRTRKNHPVSDILHGPSTRNNNKKFK
jgi:hypothetical protein